jgi:processive 1,2-diacylglycerol beta-glucosyltransferase
MGGAAGTAYSRNIIKTLEILKKNASITETAQFLLTTGKNKPLLEKLKTLTTAPRHKLHTFGFLSDEAMADLMFLSDIAITKASGLNISETLAMNTPPVLIGPFWGQERENAEFITAQKAGFTAHQPEEAIAFINRFFTHQQQRKNILKNVRSLARPRSTQAIAELLVKTAKTRVQK